ncbi:hypothetical protein PIB30_038478 [Stylosanthes scabra]|uniref:Uncharacterized protein n=1 Tax=Stylosanthes scabra TaxID=79078 RepID=A0ABU6QEB2_9FABA|nr:hypothetical protein [Stylosanthes scabra]
MEVAVGKPEVPCLFIFGDSLSDSGNNNNLSTDFKVNYSPYGVDFPDGPTGRFTNGRNAVDFITQLLGFDHFIPPYANYADCDIEEGVNYASGYAGIRYETGKHLGENVSFKRQLEHHKVIISEITKKVGGRRAEIAKRRLRKCLYYVNTGSNDYINNYFLPQHYYTSLDYTPEEFAELLVQEYYTHIKALHELGARKFILNGLNLLGCMPHEIATHGSRDTACVDTENDQVMMFNDKLRAMVDQLNEECSYSKFIYVNTAVISSSHPLLHSNGVREINKCCEVGSKGLCTPDVEPCPERNLHPFFDAIHPSEVVNRFVAASSYNSPSKSYTYPFDISHLVQS